MTCKLQSNCAFYTSQFFVILLESHVLDSNNRYKKDDNNYFIMKENEKRRCIDLLTKVIAICAGKKASFYC